MKKKIAVLLLAVSFVFVGIFIYALKAKNIFKPYAIEIEPYLYGETQNDNYVMAKISGQLPQVFEFDCEIDGKTAVWVYGISNQNDLTKLIIPNKVEIVAEPCMCSKLEEIVLGKDVWRYDVCGDNSQYSVKTFQVHTDNNEFDTLNGSLVSKDRKIIFRAIKNIDLIPNECEEIHSYAFSHTSISLDRYSLSNIKKIRYGAFVNCDNITSVFLPENILIGGSVFADCDNLSFIYLPKSAIRWNTLDNPPFADLSPTATVYCGNLDDYFPQIKTWYDSWPPGYVDHLEVDSVEAFMLYWGFVDTQTIVFGQTADDMEKAMNTGVGSLS